MSYPLAFDLYAPPGLTDLRAQLVDTSAANVGAAIDTGFVEIGTNGMYLWYYAAMPDAHRGGVKFYSNASPTDILGFKAINPQEVENADDKITSRMATFTYAAPDNATIATRASQASVDAVAAYVDTEVAAIKTKTDNLPTDPASSTNVSGVQTAIVAAIAALNNLSAVQVWTYSARTLTSFGTLVADIWSNATRTLTNSVSINPVDIWTYARRTLTSTPAETVSAMTGNELHIVRAVTFDHTFGDLIIPSTWTKIYFTAKRNLGRDDSQALIQIVVSNPSTGTDGMIILNGAVGVIANGSLAVDEGDGTVDLSIADDATLYMAEGTYSYDLKAVTSASESILLATERTIVSSTPTKKVV